MFIDFEKIDTEKFKNFKGGEKEASVKMFSDGKNKILKLWLLPGASIGMHTHVTSSEIIYILEGKGKMLTKDGEEILNAGDCHYLPKGESHSLLNIGDSDLVIFAVVPEQ